MESRQRIKKKPLYLQNVECVGNLTRKMTNTVLGVDMLWLRAPRLIVNQELMLLKTEFHDSLNGLRLKRLFGG